LVSFFKNVKFYHPYESVFSQVSRLIFHMNIKLVEREWILCIMYNVSFSFLVILHVYCYTRRYSLLCTRNGWNEWLLYKCSLHLFCCLCLFIIHVNNGLVKISVPLCCLTVSVHDNLKIQYFPHTSWYCFLCCNTSFSLKYLLRNYGS